AGVIYLELNQVDLAIHSFQQALATDPTYKHAHFNLSRALLLKGELRTGFIEYEWRWQCQDIPNLIPSFSQPLSQALAQPLWNGSNFSGLRLLISAEQGFGDVIQFIRYIPLVKTLGGENGKILFGCPTSLKRLFEGIKDVTLVGDDISSAEFDLRVPLLSLPRILDTTIDSIPATIPYLFVPTDRLVDSSNEFSQSKTHQLRVGVVWATYGNSPSIHKRSCPLPIFVAC
ncbi:MAG: tetratricopeptide repeat protein, partial [Pseudanabaena sp. RU_4_16]|nr:tetratricopeptide repeat protein [Pseudanabaena sp. RU_4_16]